MYFYFSLFSFSLFLSLDLSVYFSLFLFCLVLIFIHKNILYLRVCLGPFTFDLISFPIFVYVSFPVSDCLTASISVYVCLCLFPISLPTSSVHLRLCLSISHFLILHFSLLFSFRLSPDPPIIILPFCLPCLFLCSSLSVCGVSICFVICLSISFLYCLDIRDFMCLVLPACLCLFLSSMCTSLRLSLFLNMLNHAFSSHEIGRFIHNYYMVLS